MWNKIWLSKAKKSLLFSCSIMSNSLQPHGLQHSKLPCPSPSPRAYSNSVSIKSVMPSNHPVLCHPLLLLPSIFPSIKIRAGESAVHIRGPKYWNFSFNPSSESSGLISFRIDCFDFLAGKGLSRVFFSTTIWKHQFFGAQPSLWFNSHIHMWVLEKP